MTYHDSEYNLPKASEGSVNRILADAEAIIAGKYFTERALRVVSAVGRMAYYSLQVSGFSWMGVDPKRFINPDYEA